MVWQAAAQVGLGVASGMYSARQKNKAIQKQNEQVLASLGRSLGDLALQGHQQQLAIREAKSSVQKQGKEQAGVAQALALASDTFGDSVREQQMDINRQTVENELRLEQSSANTQESLERAIQNTVLQHKASLQALGSSGLVEGLMGGVGAGIKSGTINENTLPQMGKAVRGGYTLVTNYLRNGAGDAD